MKLPNLLPRPSAAPAGPTLRQRAAALRHSLSRLVRDTKADIDVPRRALVTTGLAAAAAAPFPALAAPVATTAVHPDQALLDAERTYRDADAAYETARDALSDARGAVRKALGLYPETLHATGWEERNLFAFPVAPVRGMRGLPHRTIQLRDEAGNFEGQVSGWTERGLRMAIERAVPALGRGGQTPHRVRRWKAMLPIAVQHDGSEAELNARFRIVELTAAMDAAEKVRSFALAQLDGMPATTLDGLAVKVRWIDRMNWHTMPSGWTTLLESAAILSGTALTVSTFDSAGWAREFEEAGGTIERTGNLRWWSFNIPRDRRRQPISERAAELLREVGHHGHEIRRWLNTARGF